MRILVLGATGYVGSRVVPALIEAGHQVLAASSSEPDPDRFSWGHEVEWLTACKSGPAAMSSFDYADPLAEFVLLGNVATLVGETIEFDPIEMKVINNQQADAALGREYRQGWSL